MEGLDATVATQARGDQTGWLRGDEWHESLDCTRSRCASGRPSRRVPPGSRVAQACPSARNCASGSVRALTSTHRRALRARATRFAVCGGWRALQPASDSLARRWDKLKHKWDLTFDMSGTRRRGMEAARRNMSLCDSRPECLAVACPLDGGVRLHSCCHS